MKVPLLAATILLVLVGFTHGAGSGTLTTTTVQTLDGVLFKITGAFTVTSTRFTLATTDIPIPANTPCTWAIGECIMNEVFPGNWTLEITLQLNSGFVPVTTTAYTMLVRTSFPIPAQSTIFSVPSTATAPSSMFFFIDLGTQTFLSPAGYVIQVQ